jgi:hypothetical protein
MTRVQQKKKEQNEKLITNKMATIKYFQKCTQMVTRMVTE